MEKHRKVVTFVTFLGNEDWSVLTDLITQNPIRDKVSQYKVYPFRGTFVTFFLCNVLNNSEKRCRGQIVRNYDEEKENSVFIYHTTVGLYGNCSTEVN